MSKVERVDSPQATKNVLQIFTMGHFHVKYNDRVISEDSGKSYKIWKLFNYFLTFKDKLVPAEMIMETLWPDKHISNPQHNLSNLVYRLRQVLNCGGSRGGGIGEKECYIVFKQGSYVFNKNADYWLDTEEFEKLCLKARSLAGDNPQEAIELYEEGLSLYMGEYLPALAYEDWVSSARKYYHRLYLKSVLDLSELLQKMGNYSEMENILERALQQEPFEEELHINFLEALIEQGKYSKVKSHYEEVVSLFQRELGVKPSRELSDLYERIGSKNRHVSHDLGAIQEGLSLWEEADGAFLCEPDTFRLLYRLEERRAQRRGEAVFLGSFTVLLPGQHIPPRKKLEQAVAKLKLVLKRTLRKGDIICRWNDTQFLVLLPGLSAEQVDKTMKRVSEVFIQQNDIDGIVLEKSSRALKI